MGTRLTERRRVGDEGPRVVNPCRGGGRGRKALDRSPEEARAKFVPAAAVRRTVRTLFGITGLKGRVDGSAHRTLKAPGLTGEQAPRWPASSGGGGPGTAGGAVKCVEIGRNTDGESEVLDSH